MNSPCDVDRMTMNNELVHAIEQLVRMHVEAMRAAAATAVERAFTPPARTGRSSGMGAARPEVMSTKKAIAPRRAAAELAVLGERFYAVLCRQPGETMTTLAAQAAASPQALQVAVARLKRAGRVRTVGQRQHTRYFPLTSAPATT